MNIRTLLVISFEKKITTCGISIKFLKYIHICKKICIFFNKNEDQNISPRAVTQ